MTASVDRITRLAHDVRGRSRLSQRLRDAAEPTRKADVACGYSDGVISVPAVDALIRCEKLNRGWVLKVDASEKRPPKSLPFDCFFGRVRTNRLEAAERLNVTVVKVGSLSCAQIGPPVHRI